MSDRPYVFIIPVLFIRDDGLHKYNGEVTIQIKKLMRISSSTKRVTFTEKGVEFCLNIVGVSCQWVLCEQITLLYEFWDRFKDNSPLDNFTRV